MTVKAYNFFNSMCDACEFVCFASSDFPVQSIAVISRHLILDVMKQTRLIIHSLQGVQVTQERW